MDTTVYLGSTQASLPLPIKAVDQGDGSYALKVTTTPGGGDPGNAGVETGMDWPFTYAD